MATKSTTATKPTPAKATPKAQPKAEPAKKAPVAKSVEVKKSSLKEAPEKKAKVTEEPKKKPVPKPKKEINLSEMKTSTPKEKAPTTNGKTTYHVSKRDKDGREWKVFIEGSTKVIKLFDTQAEALKYAQGLCKNKDDGSYVLLHGLDGKIRKY